MIIGLAPMDGYTDCAFRQITKEIFLKYGEKEKYDFVLWTEFMNADGYIINPPGVAKHLMTTNEQAPVIAQVFGSDEKMLMKCFDDIQQKYSMNGKLEIENGKFLGGLSRQEDNTQHAFFSGLELNLGCPAKNVMCSGGGSALLKDKEKTLMIIKKLAKILEIPLSIKTRTGLNEDDKDKQMEFLLEASKYVSMITIHGRTVKQGYTGESKRDFVYELKRRVTRSREQGAGSREQEPVTGNLKPVTACKILGNGSIHSYQDIELMKGDLDGILIGQSAIGNPRIFTPHIPDSNELKETILRHLDLMIAYEYYYQSQKEKFDGTLTMPKEKDIDTIISTLSKPIVPSLVLHQGGFQNPLFQQAIVIAFRKHLFQYIKGIPGSKERKEKLTQIKDYETLVEEIQKFL